MEIKIVRSKRRKKTISAQWEENGTVLTINAPAHMTDAQLAPYIDDLKAQAEEQQAKWRRGNDEKLERRAKYLNRKFFDNQLRWNAVRWVTNQNTRWGSCSANRGTIRLSHRLLALPQYVQDYVLIHELAHLAEPNHGDAFWDLVHRFPKAERAIGFLHGIEFEAPLE